MRNVRKRLFHQFLMTAAVIATVALVFDTVFDRRPKPESPMAAPPARPIPAQFVQFGSKAKTPQVIGVFLPVPRELKQHLSIATKSIADQRYSDAVAEIGTLLTKLDSANESNEDYAGDYFLGSRGEEGTQTSLRTEAERLLGSLPEPGRQWYELQYGAQAQRLLNEALAQGQPQKLEEVTRRFFHTKAGYEATLLLGRYQLNRGRPRAAALSLQRLASSPAAARHEPELSLLLATSWLCAGREEQAEATLEYLQGLQPGAQLQVGNQVIDLTGTSVAAVRQLAEVVGAPQHTAAANVDFWGLHRGNACRNATTSGSAPLANCRWFQRLSRSDAEANTLSDYRKRFAEQRLPVLPATQPLIVGDTVLARSSDYLLGVDVKSGKIIWYYPTCGIGFNETGDSESDILRPRSPSSPEMQKLMQRLWDDAVYGQLSSDGQSVFVIDQLGHAGINTYGTIIGPGGLRRPGGSVNQKTNVLVALDLKTQGKMRWMIGGENGEDEPKLANAFFLGPPLPMLAQLYSLVEINGEIRLVVLDANTGRQVWSQQLAHVDNATIDRHAIRRLAGASPSFADGVLICPTSAGAVVAVDISTRSLLWGYQYPQANIDPRYARMSVHYQQRYNFQPGNRWQDATTTLASGRVLITPVESNDIHCLDLLTGKVLWKKGRGESLFVGGVFDDKVMMVAKEHVSALNVSNGSDSWNKKTLTLPGRGVPSGRGYGSGDFYYLPTTNQELVKIDVAKGEIVHNAKTDGILGNLVCHEEIVVCQSATRLTSFFQLDPLKDNVAEILEKNPDDAWALARHGELLLHDGKRAEALEAIRRSYKIEPRADTRALLVETLIATMRDNAADGHAAAAELNDLRTTPDQQAEFLRLMATGQQAAGKNREAIETYLRLADIYSQTDRAAGNKSDPIFVEDEEYLSVRGDVWVQSRLAELFARANAEDTQAVGNIVSERYKKAAESRSTSELKSFIQLFGQHELGQQARIDLAKLYLDRKRGEILAAEHALLPLMNSANQSHQATATALLAQALAEAQQTEAAADRYRTLKTQFADTPCLDGKTGRQLVEALDETGTIAQTLADSHNWPTGKAEFKEGGDEVLQLSGYQRTYPVRLVRTTGQTSPDVRLVLNTNRTGVEVRDAIGRKTVVLGFGSNSGARLSSSNTYMMRGRYFGHLLTVSALGGDIVAFDTLKQTQNAARRELWRKSGSNVLPGQTTTNRRLRPTATETPWGQQIGMFTDDTGSLMGRTGTLPACGAFYWDRGRLTCCDPLTGSICWHREDIPFGSDLFGDDEILLAIPPKSNEATVVRAADGHLLGHCTVPVASRRWAMQGRYILTWDDKPLERKIRLFDPWEDRDLWTRSVPSETKGYVNGRHIALLQTDGAFTVLDVADGSVLVDEKLDPEPNMMSIRFDVSADQFTLMTNRPITRTDGTTHISAAPAGSALLMNGSLYAFNRATGKPAWQSPANIKEYGMPVVQPTNLPLILFMRHVRKSERGHTGTRTSILGIDRRDGRMLFHKEGIALQTGAFELVGNPEKNTVQVQLPRKTYTLTLTDQPRPPEPPAQTGASSSVPPDVPGHSVGKVAGSIFGALTKGAAVAPKADRKWLGPERPVIEELDVPDPDDGSNRSP